MLPFDLTQHSPPALIQDSRTQAIRRRHELLVLVMGVPPAEWIKVEAEVHTRIQELWRQGQQDFTVGNDVALQHRLHFWAKVEEEGGRFDANRELLKFCYISLNAIIAWEATLREGVLNKLPPQVGANLEAAGVALEAGLQRQRGGEPADSGSHIARKGASWIGGTFTSSRWYSKDGHAVNTMRRVIVIDYGHSTVDGAFYRAHPVDNKDDVRVIEKDQFESWVSH
ncbi:hypothetical protein DACRYDRAFT_106568 [Dacryopinax primogenitus]|uniref:Uncharacterized protein n=1 Tax=Dacryopinax primogenitus (strain DJM 731) TaxID=1858805 RepID=M5GBH9_DACPD|nr:uncharacterized protein DACRYDRAFT_106568 [Dacryopinax primogenitus]EJU03412.1 hypothetical protein DACRYDRAFT_106568 [Dacryopinax primogenitus]